MFTFWKIFIAISVVHRLVTIEMKGSCAGCPSSAITLKSGIEGMLKHYVQEVNTVEAVDYSGKE